MTRSGRSSLLAVSGVRVCVVAEVVVAGMAEGVSRIW